MVKALFYKRKRKECKGTRDKVQGEYKNKRQRIKGIRKGKVISGYDLKQETSQQE